MIRLLPTLKIADSNPLNSLKKIGGNFDNFCHSKWANFAFSKPSPNIRSFRNWTVMSPKVQKTVACILQLSL